MTGKVKMEKRCPECGEEFKQLAQHWRWNPSHRVEFTDVQWETAVGILMGDGTINRTNKNPLLEVSMINKAFLEWLDTQLEPFSNGVRKVKTAQEAAEENQGRALFPVVNSEQYHDIYHLSTCGHPGLEELVEWYEGGDKTWPTDVMLTPRVMSMWYVSDGYHYEEENTGFISMSVNNEGENVEKVEQYFNRAGLPAPKWSRYQREDGYTDVEIYWSVEDSHTFWEYMDGPVPGFGYKWDREYRGDNR